MYKVDLNCDMGESFGLYELGNDEEMMQYITSANIACGFHGGDPHMMRKTVALAQKYNVSIGAHPAFPDLLGFGRRALNCTSAEIKDYITYQVGALKEFAAAEKLELQHCKPHGALYMQAMENKEIARAILETVHTINPNMIVFAMNQSEVVNEALKMGVPVAKEVYSDREHTETGSIILTRKGSEIKDYDEMAKRVVRMVTKGRVVTYTGKDIFIRAETVCIHGDTPGAVRLAKCIVEHLKEAGAKIIPAKNIIL